MKMTAVWTSALDFVLHQLEGIRIDNGWVRVLDVILRDLAIIFLDSFGEEIYGVGFLRYDSITDTIQFFLRARVQGGSNFLGRVQRAKIR